MKFQNLALCGLVLLVGIAHAQLGAQDKMTSQDPAKVADSSESATSKAPFVGRLPRYFSRVVSPEQRETIYEIQHSFRARIEKLEQELAELKQEQTMAVESVLSKVQIAQVVELREQASLRLASRRANRPVAVEAEAEADKDATMQEKQEE